MTKVIEVRPALNGIRFGIGLSQWVSETLLVSLLRYHREQKEEGRGEGRGEVHGPLASSI